MWTTERQPDFRFCEHAAEIQEFMDVDLLVLSGLTTQLPPLMGARVITEKGYAIDALSNQRITRLHYDVDILLATPHPDHVAETSQLVREVVERTTNLEWTITPQKRSSHVAETSQLVREVVERTTNLEWTITPQKRSSWVKLHEASKRQWDDGITGTKADLELAHQLDLHFVHSPQPFAETGRVEFWPKPGVTYSKPVTTARMFDTKGRNFNLLVPTREDILATKLRLLKPFESFYGHTPRQSDIYDFKLLFDDPHFRPDHFVELLQDYYSKHEIPASDASVIIQQELMRIKDLVPDRLWQYLDAQPDLQA